MIVHFAKRTENIGSKKLPTHLDRRLDVTEKGLPSQDPSNMDGPIIAPRPDKFLLSKDRYWSCFSTTFIRLNLIEQFRLKFLKLVDLDSKES